MIANVFKKAKCFTSWCFSLRNLQSNMQKHICLKQAVILAPTSNFFATIAALCNKHETSSRKYITDFSGNIRLSSVGSKGHVCRLLLIDFDPCCWFRSMVIMMDNLLSQNVLWFPVILLVNPGYIVVAQ